MFSQEATKFSPREMVCKVVFRSIRGSTKVEFVEKGVIDKNTTSDVLNIIEEISLTLNKAHRLKQNHNHNNNDCGNHNHRGD